MSSQAAKRRHHHRRHHYSVEEFWGEAHTELIWYDADTGLIFNLAEYPDESDTARTAAQLITLAESMTTQ